MSDLTPCARHDAHEHTYDHDSGESIEMRVDTWGEVRITEGLMHDLLRLCGWKRAES